MATAYAETTPKGVDKVSRYKWTSVDRPGEFKMLDKQRIQIDASYQRTANDRKIKELTSKWSWIACGSITVAKRNGEYWAIDGQHRVLAAMRRSDITAMPCMIFDTEEVSEEAQGFLNANKNRKPVSAIAAHRAQVVAGDMLAIRLQALLDHLGLVIQDSPHAPFGIRCIAQARRQAAEDFDRFRDVLTLCVDLAKADSIVITERLIDGLGYLNKNVEGGFRDNARLRKRIHEIGGRRLLEGAARAAAYFSKGGAKVFAAGMLDVLNKGLQRRFETVTP
jgi:uncharacterized protein YijF (DUF1287 family)